MNDIFGNRLTITNPLLLSIILLTIVIGGILLNNNIAIWNILLIIIAHVLLLFSLLKYGLLLDDWLNPLSIIILIGLVRFSLPLFLLQFNSPNIEIYNLMGVGHNQNWYHANILAMIGLLGVLAGWHITFKPQNKINRKKKHIPRAAAFLAVVGMLLGLIFVWKFIESNASFEEAVLTGSFRGTEIKAGTGKYFHLGLMSISCSVILSAYLIRKRSISYLISLMPVILTMLFYFILGGRTRAITPIIAGLLVVWYERENATFTVKNTLVSFLVFIGILIFYSGTVMFRANYGLEGFMDSISFSALMHYINTAIWIEIGQLHTLAGAILVGPGVLDGVTFTKLLWPLSEIIGLPGNSTGVYLADTLVGFHSGNRWGFHATIIGDAYVNFGLLGLSVVTIIFGSFLKYIYLSYKGALINSAIYALIIVYCVRIFYESIEKYSEFFTIMVYAIGLFVIASTHFYVKKYQYQQ